MTTQEQKGEALRALHAGEPFVIPNPWDAGSARVLEALGFRALATTSSGFAFTLGRLDGERDPRRGGERTSRRSTRRPSSRSRWTSRTATAPAPRAPPTRSHAWPRRARSAARSRTGIPRGDLYELDHAVERVAAAAETAHALRFPFALVARAENHIRGNPDLDDTIARLQAFEAAGADVLYAPGLRTTDEIRTVCEAVSKPVNVLALPGLTVAEIYEAGAQRVSVGGSLAWVAVAAFADAATAIRDGGDLSPLATSLRLGDWLG